MGIVLDTSIIVAAESGTMAIASFLEQLGDEPVGISAITASELLHGVHRATDRATRTRRAALVDALLDPVPILPFGLAEARRHAALWADLMKDGAVIGAHDMLIAATALARGDALATLDRNAFERVPGLRVVDQALGTRHS